MDKKTAPLTYAYGAAYQGDPTRPVLVDPTGTPDGHALVSRAVTCINAMEEVRAWLESVANGSGPIGRDLRAEARAMLARIGTP
jgi:hypothetical protein